MAHQRRHTGPGSGALAMAFFRIRNTDQTYYSRYRLPALNKECWYLYRPGVTLEQLARPYTIANGSGAANTRPG